MSFVLSRENILLAYRNIKINTVSKTAGTDKLIIKDVGKLTPDELVAKVRFTLSESKHGYRPKPVRRKEIPKLYAPTKTRPLGIPCIFDRLIQQCIKQIMESICEAKIVLNELDQWIVSQWEENPVVKNYKLQINSKGLPNKEYVSEAILTIKNLWRQSDNIFGRDLSSNARNE